MISCLLPPMNLLPIDIVDTQLLGNTFLNDAGALHTCTFQQDSFVHMHSEKISLHQNKRRVAIPECKAIFFPSLRMGCDSIREYGRQDEGICETMF